MPAPRKSSEPETTLITVRWLDGLLESFDCSSYRIGGGLLFLEIEGTNRHIPFEGVRWYSVIPPSKEEF